MSRAPHRPLQKQQSRTPISSPSRARVGSPNVLAAPTPTPRPRTKSTPKPPPGLATPSRKPPDKVESSPTKLNVSIREAIALKRAEAKKSNLPGGGGLESVDDLRDALPVASNQIADDDTVDLGRWSLRQTIERARSTGSINLSSRSLPCLPSALFEIHLAITPNALDSVPTEPPIDSSSHHATLLESKAKRTTPTWFEAQDLLTLKARTNEIVEIQSEIHLFGSLKVVDLHQNKIRLLPDTFADLISLTTLDLSHNQIEALPTNLFALPSLTFLDISHNALTSLPFNEPFSDPSFKSRPNHSEISFFAPIITRASVPLPCLLTLNASNNKISASAIDQGATHLPSNLTKIDLSGNPLASSPVDCRSLLQALAKLTKVKELRLENTGLGVYELPPDLLPHAAFPALELLDLGRTDVTEDIARAAFSGVTQTLSIDDAVEKTSEGVLSIIVGKKVIREPWELDVGKRVRKPARVEQETPALPTAIDTVEKVVKAPSTPSVVEIAPSDQKSVKVVAQQPPVIVKEAWEIEAEQGLLTEGGRRLARIRAAAKANEQHRSAATSDNGSNSSGLSSPLSQYYTPAAQSLTLPPSAPPTKSAGHSRTFSLAVSSSTSPAVVRTMDVFVPTPTLPLTVISVQPFAPNLRTLILANRRKDRSFNLPFTSDSSEGPCLPNLEELSLEGCGFGDKVNVSRQQAAGSDETARSSEMLLPLLTRLFPSLRSLDLSFNLLTSESLTTDILRPLILSSSGDATSPEESSFRKGLKYLHLRGNKITDLEGLRGVAALFRGNRDVPAWKLDELDLRDNEIGKLPPELGLMPLDVFLVDGNIFRVPQRRIWEREGTKGLLSWLRGRIE